MPPSSTYGEIHAAQQRAVMDFARQPRNHNGRGIVTSVYDHEFASAWVLLSELARLKVDLPVEAFHNADELSPRQIGLLMSLGLNLSVRQLVDNVHGYGIKPLAIWRSSFREALWLDCDSFPLRDPAFLFDDPEYRTKGSLFWRDVSGVERSTMWHPQAPVWGLFNVPPNDAEEFESGQLLIDKDRCWSELGLTVHFTSRPELYGKVVLGDKDMFRLAWQNLAAARKKAPKPYNYLSQEAAVPYGFMPFGPFHMGRANWLHKWGGGSVMVQRGRDGAPLFVHRNLEKFKIDGENYFNADVPNEAIYHEHIARLRDLLKQA